MGLSFFVRVDDLPTFNAIVGAAALGEPVQLAGAGWTGDAWPKGLFAPIADVSNAPSALELTTELEASFARAGVAASFVAFTRGAARGVVVTREKNGVRVVVPALASGPDYALGIALAAAAARLAKTAVAVGDAGAPEADVSEGDLAKRFAGAEHAKQTSSWLADDIANGRTYFFFGPRGWTRITPEDLGGTPEPERFDRALALLVGDAADGAKDPDTHRAAVLLTAAMLYAASADGKIDEEEAKQLEAHFATVKELAPFDAKELAIAARDVSGLAPLAELRSARLRRKAFVLAGEVIASAQDGRLGGKADDPNVKAVSALATALGLDGDQIFLAQVVRTAMTKYGKAEVAPDTIALGMVLAAAADGIIEASEAVVLGALARTVPELAKTDPKALFSAVEKRVAAAPDKELGGLGGEAPARNKCFVVAAEVALVTGLDADATLLPKLRTQLAPEGDLADSAVATFAAKYA
jgi:hypothetical protein